MKIALPITSFLPRIGGMEVGIHNLAKNLKELGHDPFVITSYSIYKELKKKKIKLPYKVIPFFPRMFYFFEKNKAFGFFFSEKYIKLLQKIYKFDFWHITMGFPLGVMFINFSKKNNFHNYVIRCVGEDIQVNKDLNYGYILQKKNREIIKNYFPHCNNFISISKSIYQRYIELGIKPNSIHKIPNGVSLKRFKHLSLNKKNEIKKKYGISYKTRVFVTLGRNHAKKNYKFLIKLIILMKKQKMDFKFLIVGQGVKELKSEIDSENISNQIILIDTAKNFMTNEIEFPSSKIVNYLLISDFFIFPSVLESFGVVIIEAMAAGLPIIANNVPGSKDLIIDKKTGFLCKNINDTESYLRKIELLITNKKLASKMRLDCIKESSKYDWEKICSTYLNLYESIIKKNRMRFNIMN